MTTYTPDPLPDTYLDGLTAAMDSGVFDLTPGEVATVEAIVQESSKS